MLYLRYGLIAVSLGAVALQTACSISFNRKSQPTSSPVLNGVVGYAGDCPRQSLSTIPTRIPKLPLTKTGTWNNETLGPESNSLVRSSVTLVSDIADDGRQAVAWVGSSTSGSNTQTGLFAKLKDGTGTWLPPQFFPGFVDANSTVTLDSISLTPSGAVLVWNETRKNAAGTYQTSVMSAIYLASSGVWLVQKIRDVLNPYTTNDGLQFFALPDGTRTLLWLESSAGASSGTYRQSRLESDGKWSDACSIAEATVTTAQVGVNDRRFKSIAQVDSSSGAILLLFRTPQNLIESIYLDPTGASSAPSVLPGVTAIYSGSVIVSFAGPSQARLLWGLPNIDNYASGIYSSTYSVATNGWSQTQTIQQNGNFYSAFAGAVSDNGKAVVAWLQNDGTVDSEVLRVHGSYFDSQWSAAQLLDFPSAGGRDAFRNITLQIDDSGNAMAVFGVPGSDGRTCCAVARYQAGSGWKPTEALIPSEAANFNYLLGFALLPGGAAHLAVSRTTSLATDIYLADYDPNSHSWSSLSNKMTYSGAGGGGQLLKFSSSGIGAMIGGPAVATGGPLYLLDYR